MWRTPVILVASLALLLVAVASAFGAVLEPLPSRLRAGETIEIRWGRLPLAIEEVELELSLDGRRWERISPECDPARGGFAWKVPNRQATAARIRLRAGGEGHERALDTGEPFAILPAPAREPLLPGGACDWDAFAPGSVGHSDLDAHGDRFSAVRRALALAAPHGSVLLPPAHTRPRMADASALPAATPARTFGAPRAPFRSLRI